MCDRYLKIISDRGAYLQLNTQVYRLKETNEGLVRETNPGEFKTRFVINCAGLYSDRSAQNSGIDTQAKRFPFRG